LNVKVKSVFAKSTQKAPSGHKILTETYLFRSKLNFVDIFKISYYS